MRSISLISDYVFLTFIFCFLFSFAQEDSLPSLPNPYDLELKLTLPKEKLTLTDTAGLLLLGGLTYSPPNLNFGKPVNSKVVIPIRLRNKFFLFSGDYLSDIDYEPYRSFSTQIISYISLHTAFLKNDLLLGWKDRPTASFERIALTHWSVHPFFFGELNPQSAFRFSRYFRYQSHPFYNFSGQIGYTIPTIISNLGLNGSFLIQSNTSPIGSVSLFDHIILRELIFIKPQISYWFVDRGLTFLVNSGARIKKTLTLVQFAYNDKQLLNFDSIYSSAEPLAVNHLLRYPVSQLSIKISILTNNQEIGLYARLDKDRIHFLQSNSEGKLLFHPENCEQKSVDFNLKLKNSMSNFLNTKLSWENRLLLGLNLGKLSLIPMWAFSDYLTLLVKGFGFTLNSELIGKRKVLDFSNNTEHQLNSVFRLNANLFYSHSFILLKIGCRNILGTVWEVYPAYQDNHRKLFLELSISRTL